MKSGIAPDIISASRATDIPAFYCEWLLERMRSGYCVRINPFDRKARQYISFSKCKCIVFWSKNPEPILKHLKFFDDRGINYYFQFTVNDYVKEKFEPRLPSLEQRLETFIQLSDMIGKEKVLWRFDPVILSEEISISQLIDKIHNIAERLCAYTENLIFSFVDIHCYKNVPNNIKRASLSANEPDAGACLEIAKKIVKMNASLKHGLALRTCAEATDVSRYGIHHNSCIDNALINRICKSETKRQIQKSLLENQIDRACAASLKDSGQRKHCLCRPAKDIGAYNTCPHMCAYCYANYSRRSVLSNYAKIRNDGEALI
jgi:hypothetical protein